ncbi:hypothetical protein HanPI659440_Chr12g0454471 [Helianthus annuus]|nr:hypothetical protein HanPI659440_Chr12g0454471 [Helianthus annuus]
MSRARVRAHSTYESLSSSSAQFELISKIRAQLVTSFSYSNPIIYLVNLYTFIINIFYI